MLAKGEYVYEVGGSARWGGLTGVKLEGEKELGDLVGEFLEELGFEGGVHTRDGELRAGVVDGVVWIKRGESGVRVVVMDWEVMWKKDNFAVSKGRRVDIRGVLKAVLEGVRELYLG